MTRATEDEWQALSAACFAGEELLFRGATCLVTEDVPCIGSPDRLGFYVREVALES